MAIEDRQLMMSLDQAVTASAATTDYIDLGAARNIGVGEELCIVFTVTTTTASAGATTLDLVLQGDSSAAFGSAVTIQTVFTGIPKATLIAGYQFVAKLNPSPALTGYRYIRGSYTVNTANFSAGAFRLGLQLDAQLWKAPSSPYPV